MTILCYDLETDSRMGTDLAKAHQSRILSIGVTNVATMKDTLLIGDDERETVLKFMEMLKTCTVLVGYFSRTFDDEFLRVRLTILDIDATPFNNVIHLDFVDLHKHLAKRHENAWSLEKVSQKYLHHGKVPFDSSKTWQAFSGGEKSRAALGRYNVQDAHLVAELLVQAHYLELFTEIIALTGADAQRYTWYFRDKRKDQSPFNVSVPIFALLKQKAEARDPPFELPRKPEAAEVLRRSGDVNPGGYVFPVKKGLHTNVILLDFSQMYPNVMKAWNVGIETFHWDGSGEIRAPRGSFVSKPLSLVAEAISELMKKRLAVKAELKKYENRELTPAEKEEEALLKAKSEAIKVVLNSFYGIHLSKHSSLYNKDVGSNVPLIGQMLITTMIKHLEGRGMTIVAGDTDSVFVEGFTGDPAAFSKELSAWLNEYVKAEYGCNDPTFAFDYKKSLSSIYFLGKKNYAFIEAGKTEPEFVGRDRGDIPPLKKDILFKRLTARLKGESEIEAWVSATKRFANGEDDKAALRWVGANENTKVETAQKKALVVLREAGVNIEPDENVGYIILKDDRIAASESAGLVVRFSTKATGPLDSFLTQSEREEILRAFLKDTSKTLEGKDEEKEGADDV